MNGPPRIYENRVVLITGGTKGLGLGIALLFAAHGAQTVLTCRWGSADPNEVRKRFADIGGLEPLIVEADVSRSDDTKVLFETIKKKFGQLYAFISNASNAATVQSVADLTERAFLQSMRAGAWPTVEYTLASKEYFGRYPRYVVVISSDGPDRYTPAYDFVASAKSATEVLARYLAYRLRQEDFRINVIRSRAIKTDSFTQTFGGDFYDFLRSLMSESWFITVEEVAKATFGLCSGMFDAMTGQVVVADRGNTFADCISVLYDNRTSLGL
jgi:NAD(P)-dependent dehydrogenase (short-subunit alcohol dehydrogenase family)